MKRFALKILGSTLASLMVSGGAWAATSVAWLTPPDGSSYPVGTIVNPTGAASGTGRTGGGLDLALVLDASGSMAGPREEAQEAAAQALVAGLPSATSSVAVVRFASRARLVLGLTPVSTGLAAINAAIVGTGASGGTNMGAGIDTAAAALTGARHTPGRTQMMVVISDGVPTSGASPGERADAAIQLGVDKIHAIGVRGHDPSTMQGIVNGVDDVFGTADDHGIYLSGPLAALVALFNGTGGNLVGLDALDVILPDGNMLFDHPTDGLGNFVLPDWVMLPGANTFDVVAYGTDGTKASASLTLYGTSNGVPDGGTTALLFGSALGMLSLLKRQPR